MVADFFHMGGYAFYVWSSYSIVLVVMLINFFWPVLQKKRLIGKLHAAEIRKQQLARRQP